MIHEDILKRTILYSSIKPTYHDEGTMGLPILETVLSHRREIRKARLVKGEIKNLNYDFYAVILVRFQENGRFKYLEFEYKIENGKDMALFKELLFELEKLK